MAKRCHVKVPAPRCGKKSAQARYKKQVGCLGGAYPICIIQICQSDTSVYYICIYLCVCCISMSCLGEHASSSVYFFASAILMIPWFDIDPYPVFKLSTICSTISEGHILKIYVQTSLRMLPYIQKVYPPGN